MSDRDSTYNATCKPSEYSEEELTYILDNCGPTDEPTGDAWHDERIVSMPTGDAVTDAAYRMERASREYSTPQTVTIGSAK